MPCDKKVPTVKQSCCEKVERVLEKASAIENKAFDMFYNQMPMDVEFPSYDREGNKIIISIPNISKSKTTPPEIFSYRNESVPDKYLSGVNIFGSTGATVSKLVAQCVNISKNVSLLSGSIVLEGFSAMIPNDTTWSFYFDVKSFARDQGWFENILEDSFVDANAQFSEYTINSSAHQGIYSKVKGSANHDESVSGMIIFRDEETNSFSEMEANRLVIIFNATLDTRRVLND